MVDIISENVDLVVNNTTSCATPFTTGKLQISAGQKEFIVFLDFGILAITLCASSVSIHALHVSQQTKKKPSINLLFYSCLSDVIFAISAQTLFSVKIFHPEYPCSYDLMVEVVSNVFGDLSLLIVILVALSRYVHTQHMIRVKQMITHARVHVAVGCAFCFSCVLSSVQIFAEAYMDVNVHLQIEIIQTAYGVGLLVLVVMIYRRSEIIANRRIDATKGNDTLHFTSFSAKVLRKIMLSTLCTLLPLRIPFFCTTVMKAVLWDKNRVPLSRWMQFFHLLSYLIYCSSAGANAMIFIFNNKSANKIMKIKWETFLLWSHLQKPGKSLFISSLIFLLKIVLSTVKLSNPNPFYFI